MSERIIMVTCPLCGMNRVLEKKGSRAIIEHKPLTKGIKGRIRFDHIDLEKAFIVQFKERREKGRGFPTVGGLTLEEMKQNPEYQDLIEQMKFQLQRILDKL